MILRPLLGISVAACLALAACGDDTASGDPPAVGDSLRLTPRLLEATAIQVATLDLASARRQLGLPADADPVTAPEQDFDALGDAERRLAWLFDAVAGTTLSGFGRRSARVHDAIDVSQVHAVTSLVGRGPDEEAVLLRTSQPFAEIATSLADAGYERDGRLLVDEDADDLIESLYVADAGGGAVLLTDTRPSAEAAAAGDDPLGGDRLVLLDGVEGTLRFAVVPADSISGPGCVELLAIGEDAGPPFAGELVVGVDGAADPDRFTSPDPALGPAAAALADTVRFGEATADGDELTVAFEAVFSDVPAAAEMLRVALEGLPDAYYDCG